MGGDTPGQLTLQPAGVADYFEGLKRAWPELVQGGLKGALAVFGDLSAGSDFLGKVLKAAQQVSPDAPGLQATRLLLGGVARTLVLLAARLPAGCKLAPPWEDPDIEARLKAAVAAGDIVIDGRFFDAPEAVPAVAATRDAFRAAVFPPERRGEIDGLLADFGRTLRGALSSEWRAAPDTYRPILAALDDPFRVAWQDASDWEAYRNDVLVAQFDAPIFGEEFGLRQVYVPLRGAVRDRAPPRPRGRAGPDEEAYRPKRRAVDLQAHLLAWIDDAARDDPIRVISGGPGCGKSSALKALADRLSRHGDGREPHRVLFFPLHEFPDGARIIEAARDYLAQRRWFERNPLEDRRPRGDGPLLLIFDGLDELAHPGSAADRDIHMWFFSKLSTALDGFNAGAGPTVKAIVSGRNPVVDRLETTGFGSLQPHQQIDVLPYALERGQADDLDAASANPSVDQREEAWERYRVAYGESYAEMPAFLKDAGLFDLSREPLLNYFLMRQRKAFAAPDQRLDRYAVYDRLFLSVHERDTDDPRQHKPGIVFGQDQDAFERFFEGVGLAAWRSGESRVADDAAIGGAIGKDVYKAFLERLNREDRAVSSTLLAAFFVGRGSGPDAGGGVAFTHRSFGEFLAARRMARLIDQIAADTGSFGGTETYLRQWTQLFADCEVTVDIQAFLYGAAAKRAADTRLPHGLERLKAMFAQATRQGAPVSVLSEGSVDLRTVERRGANIEAGLLGALSAWHDASGTEDLLRLDWGSRDGLARLLARLASARPDRLPATGIPLRRLDLSGAYLTDADLTDADLTGANLTGAELIGAYLTGANLRGANLRGADLMGANLTGANLTGANLTGAYLTGAYLTDADLTDADLRGAYLTDADLTAAIGISRKQTDTL